MPDPLNPEFLAFQQAVAGQYSLERELGRGGMGIVYLAREVRLDRPVAIKVMPPALASRPDAREQLTELPPLVEQLEQEAQRMRRRVDELDALLSDVDGDAGSPSANLAQSPGTVGDHRALADDLKARRDEAVQRLTTAVAALENIRLDLLRPRAGSGDPGDLTQVIEAARRFGDDVRHLSAGKDESTVLLRSSV